MFVTVAMGEACTYEGGVCPPDNLTATTARFGGRPGGGPAPLPLELLWVQDFEHFGKFHAAGSTRAPST